MAIILSVIASLFLLVPFCYLTANFATFVVKEKQSKSKHLQLVSGTLPEIYWLAAYVWDLVMYVFIICCVLIVFVAFDNEVFTGTTETTECTFMVFFMYGLSVIPLSYCYTFLFEDPSSAQIGISLINFITGFVFTLAQYILMAVPGAAQLNEVLFVPIFRLFPPFQFGSCLLRMSLHNIQSKINNQQPDPLAFAVTGEGLQWMGGEAIAYFILVLLLEREIPQALYAYLRNSPIAPYVIGFVTCFTDVSTCVCLTTMTSVVGYGMVGAIDTANAGTIMLFTFCLGCVAPCWQRLCCPAPPEEEEDEPGSAAANQVAPDEDEEDSDVAAEAARVAEDARLEELGEGLPFEVRDVLPYYHIGTNNPRFSSPITIYGRRREMSSPITI